MYELVLAKIKEKIKSIIQGKEITTLAEYYENLKSMYFDGVDYSSLHLSELNFRDDLINHLWESTAWGFEEMLFFEEAKEDVAREKKNRSDRELYELSVEYIVTCAVRMLYTKNLEIILSGNSKGEAISFMSIRYGHFIGDILTPENLCIGKFKCSPKGCEVALNKINKHLGLTYKLSWEDVYDYMIYEFKIRHKSLIEPIKKEFKKFKRASNVIDGQQFLAV